MKRTAFDESRDQRIAEEATDPSLHCAARGCPNRWSVECQAGRVCSAHAWVEKHHWPRVTQEQLDAQLDRARYADAARPPPQVRPLDLADKRAILRRLPTVCAAKRGREWAVALRERELRGERLTPTVRQMWRSVLREDLRPREDDQAMPRVHEEHSDAA